MLAVDVLRDDGPTRLRQHLKDALATTAKDPGGNPNKFVLDFFKTVRRVEQALTTEIGQQEESATLLLEDVESAISLTQNESAHTYREIANGQVGESKKLVSKIDEFATVLVEIARESDAASSSTLEQAILRRFDSKPWDQGSSFSSIVLLYSDIFEALRELKELVETPNALWVAPDSFERSTSKFWVEEANLSKLLMTCASEAPLLVYGKTGRLSRADKDGPIENIWKTMSSTISSVYFDSPKLELYRERLARREGAQLLRARWYGKRPIGNEPVFLELKTHHESWVNVKSVKERVAIQEKDMVSFLYPQGDGWTKEQARNLVLSATPAMAGDKLNKAVDLLLRMHSLVRKYKLRPLVRSTYDRLAFQSSKSNSLRLTLDRNVVVSDERAAKYGKQWCQERSCDFAMSQTIPFSVFEIKLGEGQESTALNECIENGTIVDAAKFSKFLTGAACFNAVGTLPYWANHPAFSSFFSSPRGSPEPSTLATSDSEDASKYDPAPIKPSQKAADIKRPVLPWFFGNRSKEAAWVAPKKSVRVEPKTYFANERTFVQWVSAALFLVTTSALLLEFENGEGYAKLTAKTLLVFSLIIAVYALGLYYQRIWLVSTARPYGYSSHFGPVVLTGAAVAGTWIILSKLHKTEAAELVRGGGANVKELFIRNERHFCMSQDVSMFSPLEFEPSDAVVDQDRNLLLVPTLSEIYAFPLPEWSDDGLEIPSNVSPTVIAQLERADFEAATFVENTLYAISEVETTGTDFSAMLFSFEWSTLGRFEPSGQWKLAAPEAEGMAFVHDRTSSASSSYLHISSKRGTGPFSASVEKFHVPTPNGTLATFPLLEPDRVLNKKLLDENMEDPKIGAMFFFEGNLYILHDNARVVRVWNMQTGAFQAEWALPGVENSNGKQWEGIALQRIPRPSSFGGQSSNGAASLRGTRNAADDDNIGGSSSVLLLHLTHDTPAAIWTIVVEEGDVPGSIIFPPCAGV